MLLVCTCSDCVEKAPKAEALDDKVSERLWDLSMELLGLKAQD